MTRNQIAYWELQESKRSNRAKERETNRSNVAREIETNRSNLAQEKQNRINSNRNYLMNVLNLQELHRNNVAVSDLRSAELKEQSRRNRVSEAQNQSNLSLQAYEANTRRIAQKEIQRANMSREYQNKLDYYQDVKQSDRSYLLSRRTVDETNRSNLAREQVQFQSLAEQQRSNLANENIRQYSNFTQRMSVQEQVRHNQAQERETARHNITTEAFNAIQTGVDAATKLLSTLNKVV